MGQNGKIKDLSRWTKAVKFSGLPTEENLELTRRHGLKLDSIPPRSLRFRSHYRVYSIGFGLLTFLLLSFWSLKVWTYGFNPVLGLYPYEIALTGMFFLICGFLYYFWLSSKLKRSIQVFEDHIQLHDGKDKDIVFYADIESVNTVCWSLFYVKTKSGVKHYFNSTVERVDYIWEGIYRNRPDLMKEEEFEAYRLKLVQYDHHQKRKEWFFKHKTIDIMNWAVVPVLFLFFAYVFQSRSVIIHHEWLYFFRLFMYSMLVLISIAFVYSIMLKKFVFDKKISEQFSSDEGKVRDLEFEGIVLQRTKIFQLVTACFVLSMLVKLDINLYSVTKVKSDIASFKLKKGNTILIDNRYNCLGCRYQINDGDFVVFGRGVIGQVLAKEGDMVGLISQDTTGRMIASENVQEVPKGHVAVKAANGKDVVFVKIEELIGKIQN